MRCVQILGGGALSKIGARSERKLQLRFLKLSQMSDAVVGSATRKPLSVIKNPFSFGSNGPLGLGNKTMSTIGSSNGGQLSQRKPPAYQERNQGSLDLKNGTLTRHSRAANLL